MACSQLDDLFQQAATEHRPGTDVAVLCSITASTSQFQGNQNLIGYASGQLHYSAGGWHKLGRFGEAYVPSQFAGAGNYSHTTLDGDGNPHGFQIESLQVSIVAPTVELGHVTSASYLVNLRSATLDGSIVAQCDVPTVIYGALADDTFIVVSLCGEKVSQVPR